MVSLNPQAFRDQLNRHGCVAGKNLVESGGRACDVIDDDDRNTQAGRQIFQ